ncbi:MAG: protein kinase [Kofleriaceae bacterium]
MPAAEGIKFGSFVLLRRIARGGMAEVFLAQQRGLEGFDRRVAVKRILPHLADSSDFIRMFLGEAKLAAQLAHPNIVHIYEFGKVDQDYFIAMEYVDGVHAGQLMQAGETHLKISPTLVARLGADAAAALHYAHELKGPGGKHLGLVHRDVSPANIMISYDGIVKLVDFGIAKAAAATDQLTSPGQVKGKYAYMSPEQTVAQPLDGRSDVFALGIVLWELLTGKFIVPRGDAVVAMRAIRDGKLEPILHAAPDTPPQLAKAISWALETKREKRATAAELAQELEKFIKQSPEIATPMQLGNWVRNHFVREVTGQLPSIAPAGGTQMHPGTVAASHTQSQISIALTPDPDGPHGMIGASRLARHLADSGVSSTKAHGDDSVDTLEILRNKTPDPHQAVTRKPFNAPTVIAPPPAGPITGSTTIAKPPIDETSTTIDKPFTPGGGGPTLIEPPRADQEPTVLSPNHLDPDQELSDATETVQLDRTRLPPLPVPARQPFPLSTALVPPLSGPNVRISDPIPPSGGMNALGSGPQQPPNPLGFLNPWRTRPRMQDPVAQRQMRIASAIAGLVGLALISFLVALCATRSHKTVPPAKQDGAIAMTVVADAAPADAAEAALMQPADAAPIAPTFPDDAQATSPKSTEAYLEIVTFPEGGKVKVGDQVRVAPAQIVVQAGTFEVVGELAGYQDETRPVTIEPGEHFKVELTFNHHVGTAGHPAPATGKLSARTTPYAEVYENGKKIGETPFADRELTVGTHTLVFKNPLHPPETKKVIIRADKPVKLNFSLRD